MDSKGADLSNPRTRSILRVVSDLGYAVQVGQGQVTAIHREIGERYILKGDEPHALAVQLAVQVGVDFEDC